MLPSLSDLRDLQSCWGDQGILFGLYGSCWNGWWENQRIPWLQLVSWGTFLTASFPLFKVHMVSCSVCSFGANCYVIALYLDLWPLTHLAQSVYSACFNLELYTLDSFSGSSVSWTKQNTGIKTSTLQNLIYSMGLFIFVIIYFSLFICVFLLCSLFCIVCTWFAD